jgi:hypothetical protein
MVLSRPSQFFRRRSHSPFFTASIAQPLSWVARTVSIIYYVRRRFIFLEVVGIECANGLCKGTTIYCGLFA